MIFPLIDHPDSVILPLKKRLPSVYEFNCRTVPVVGLDYSPFSLLTRRLHLILQTCLTLKLQTKR